MLIETLEARRLMSVSLNPQTHLLSIVGTANADTLTVKATGNALVVSDNGAITNVALGMVKKIYVNGLDGTDKIGIDASVFVPTELHTGTGLAWDDLLQGGSGPDKIYLESVESKAYGGAGNDTLYGGIESSGLNELYGEAGNDTFIMENAGGYVYCNGGKDTDTIDFSFETDPLIIQNGETGEYDLFNGVPVPNDVAGFLEQFENFIGGRSDDWIYGDNANNIIKGGAGKDHLYGGNGNDTLDGQTGADFLYGDAGDDTLLSKDGATDFLYGGVGHDKAQKDASDMVTGVEVVVV